MSEGFLYIDQQNVVGSGNKIEFSLNSFDIFMRSACKIFFYRLPFGCF